MPESCLKSRLKSAIAYHQPQYIILPEHLNNQKKRKEHTITT